MQLSPNYNHKILGKKKSAYVFTMFERSDNIRLSSATFIVAFIKNINYADLALL